MAAGACAAGGCRMKTGQGPLGNAGGEAQQHSSRSPRVGWQRSGGCKRRDGQVLGPLGAGHVVGWEQLGLGMSGLPVLSC